ncbi:MAG: transaldolase family protein [Candidatus Izemoplasmataceae bacterium]
MYLLDSADVKTIKRLQKTYGIEGVTTNPTLMAQENRTDFFHHIREITDCIHPGTVYVQVNAEDSEGMLEEARLFLEHIKQPFSIKIPATRDGFEAMKALKEKIPVTATAIVDFHQALMALASGASTLAIYVNRMLRSGLAPFDMIESLRLYIERENLDATLIAASFKTSSEVRSALEHGAHKVTVPESLFETMFLHPLTERSVKGFSEDFKGRYGTDRIKSKN